MVFYSIFKLKSGLRTAVSILLLIPFEREECAATLFIDLGRSLVVDFGVSDATHFQVVDRPAADGSVAEHFAVDIGGFQTVGLDSTVAHHSEIGRLAVSGDCDGAVA